MPQIFPAASEWRRPGPRLLLSALCLLLVSVLHGADAPAKPAPHDFTPTEGAGFSGVIQNVIDDTVLVRKSDGQSLKVKIATLSSDDQQYIQQWTAEQANGLRGGAFQVKLATSKTNPSTSSGEGLTVTTWTEGYNVTMKNQTTFAWKNPVVRYVIFATHVAAGQVLNASEVAGTPGQTKLDEIRSSSEAKFSTDKVDMSKSSVISGYHFTNNAPKVVNDTLRGLWLRVYDANGNLLAEWSSAPDISKKLSWDAYFPARSARGGRRGAPRGNQ